MHQTDSKDLDLLTRLTRHYVNTAKRRQRAQNIRWVPTAPSDTTTSLIEQDLISISLGRDTINITPETLQTIAVEAAKAGGATVLNSSSFSSENRIAAIVTISESHIC